MLKKIFTNSAGILLSRIFGFIRDLLTASILGANIYSDIFFVAFKLPNLFRRIFAEGAFTQAFIPAYAKTSHKIRFSTIVFLHFLGFILLLSIFVTLFSTLVTKIIAIGFDNTTIILASKYVAICFYYLPLIFIVTFFAALLQYKHHFATTSFATTLLNIALIFALIIGQNQSKPIIVLYLSWAVVVGGVLQVVAHIVALRKLNIKVFTTKISNTTKTLKQSKFYKEFAPAVLGSSTAHIAAFLDTWLASFLVSGSISYLYYANRVFQLPLALFAIATSVALFPSVAKAIKHNKEQEALQYLSKAFYILFFILSISTIIGVVFSKEIVVSLFQRGNFTSYDTQQTSLVLCIYLVGLLPFGIAKIFSLWLYSKQLQSEAAKNSIKSLSANIVFSLLLIQPYGIGGLAFASSLSGFVLLYYTIRSFGYKNFQNIIKNVSISNIF